MNEQSDTSFRHLVVRWIIILTLTLDFGFCEGHDSGGIRTLPFLRKQQGYSFRAQVNGGKMVNKKCMRPAKLICTSQAGNTQALLGI